MNEQRAPAAMAAPVSSRRRQVLLLQGLMGPFFRRIGIALRQKGYGVHKVNFNGGDRLFWRLPNGVDFAGTLIEWPHALQRIIVAETITDVLLFGDCRPLHSAAIRLCRHLGIPVHVFEEGYIRPDWVTLELRGVNGHSTLPRNPCYFRERAARLPAPCEEHVGVASSFRRRAVEGVLYNTADLLTRWRYRHWRSHRPSHPVRKASAGYAGLSHHPRRDGAVLLRGPKLLLANGAICCFHSSLRVMRRYGYIRRSMAWQRPSGTSSRHSPCMRRPDSIWS